MKHQRQFLPKSVILDNISENAIKTIKDNLSNRPRKIQGHQTPLEVKSKFGALYFNIESAFY